MAGRSQQRDAEESKKNPSWVALTVRARRSLYVSPQPIIETVSELCHIPPETLGKLCRLPGHVDVYRCCRNPLIGSALVGFGVRQHAREVDFYACSIDHSDISPFRENQRLAGGRKPLSQREIRHLSF